MKPDRGGRPTAAMAAQEEQAGQEIELGEGRCVHQSIT